jgi:FdhE protein
VGTPLRSELTSGAARAFELRAARAESLAAEPSADAEPLRFVAGLLRAQGGAAMSLAARRLSGSSAQDFAAMLEPARAVLRFVGSSGPASIAAVARARAAEDDGTASERLLVYWRGDRAAADDYLSRAMLRPYVETLRELGRTPDRPHARGRCPFCGGAPGIARRQAAESQGSVRSLVCALCGLEWEIGRIHCPSCFEDDPRRLPSFTSERHPLARIEACETCRRYVKSIDTTLDGRIVPEVDDLASLALDLWAREEGFERIEPGLAGA